MNANESEKLLEDWRQEGGDAPPAELVAALLERRQHVQVTAESIDVTAAVMAEISKPRGVLLPMRRWLPVFAAASVLLYFGQQVAFARELRVSAPQGIWQREGSAWVEHRGEFSLSWPAQLQTRGFPAVVSTRAFSAELASHTDAVAVSRDELSLDRGTLTLTTTRPMLFRINTGPNPLEGDVSEAVRVKAVTTDSPDFTGEDFMKTNRGKWLAAGGLAAVLAVYTGVAHWKSGSQRSITEGGSGVAVGRDGSLHPLSLSEAEQAFGRSQTGNAELTATAAKTTGDALPTGGRWDESTQSILFGLGGEVFDAQTGKPITHFTLSLQAHKVESFGVSRNRTVTVDEAPDGIFRLEGLGLGQWELTARAEGFAPSRQNVVLKAATDDPYLVVPLSRGGNVTGVVNDWRGNPVEGALVGLRGCAPSAVNLCKQVPSNSKGEFLLQGAPEEAPFSIAALHPRMGSAELYNLRVAEGESLHVTLELSGRLKVSGTVLRGPKKTPAVGLTVRADDFETVTDAQGRYAMVVPLNAQTEVRVVAQTEPRVEFASYPTTRSSEPIRWVDAETHVAELSKDFWLGAEQASLRGQVTLADGRPLSNSPVYIRNRMGFAKRDHETFPERTTTDAAGNYRIDNIPAHAGYALWSETDEHRYDLGVVVIDEPRDVVANFSIGKTSLRGRFVEEGSGAPFPLTPRACTRFGAQSLESESVYTADCLDDGTFEFTNMVPGRYRLMQIAPKLPNEFAITAREVTLVPSGQQPLVEIVVSGQRSNTWELRATDEAKRFVPDLMLRYLTGPKGSVTSSLELRDNGTAKLMVPQAQEDVFIDAPGFVSAQISLKGREPGTLIEVTLKKEAQAQ